MISDATHAHTTVKNWEMCFDRSGNGRQTIALSDGRSCADPLHAAFGNDRSLVIDALDECHFAADDSMWRDRMNCVRESDVEANCVITTMAGPARGSTSEAKFRRARN
jgi:hypothetical protein